MNRVQYLLQCLNEELLEVGHEVSKSIRFGLHDQYKNRKPNIDLIKGEWNDVFGVLALLAEEGVVIHDIDPKAVQAKKRKVEKYYLYAANCGCISGDNLPPKTFVVRRRMAMNEIARLSLGIGAKDVDAISKAQLTLLRSNGFHWEGLEFLKENWDRYCVLAKPILEAYIDKQDQLY